ncbi:MAG: hypothetical protein DDT25_00008 [Chloroflexi bacterium]|nr:hypothetical protein [Chloroflexota bacterium]
MSDPYRKASAAKAKAAKTATAKIEAAFAADIFRVFEESARARAAKAKKEGQITKKPTTVK